MKKKDRKIIDEWSNKKVAQKLVKAGVVIMPIKSKEYRR